MNEKQLVLLNFIKRFDKICRENNIEYFIGAGSALGAIRHKGFLPWDDDIDLCMKRDEWLRAKPIFKEVFNGEWLVLDKEDYPEYNNPLVRIVDTKTTEFARSRLVDEAPHGIQLEIFILDPIPASEIGQGQYYSDFWLYYETITQNFMVFNKALNMERLPIDTYLEHKTLDEKKALVNKLEQKLINYPEEDCEYYHFRWGIEWICYPKKTFEKQLYVDFEDTKLPVACGFTEEFFQDYGDTWMMIPDVEDQQVHSTIENYHVPYKLYEECLKDYIDIKKTRDSRFVMKRNNVIKVYNDDLVRRAYLKFDNQKLDYHYSLDSDLRKTVLEALENKDYKTAGEALKLFRSQQEKNFERYMLASSDMELLGAAFEYCFVMGEWRFIEKTRKIIANKPELITEKIASIIEITAKAREAYFSQFYGNEAEYKETIYEILEKYPDQVNMIEIKHMLECYDVNTDKADCLQSIKNLNDELRKRPTILMLEIYCLLQLGRKTEAEALYENIREGMKNGMVLLKLKEWIGY